MRCEGRFGLYPERQLVNVPAGYFAGQIGGYFSKVPTIYLLGLGWANGWVLFESAHHLPTGYELGKLFQNPQ